MRSIVARPRFKFEGPTDPKFSRYAMIGDLISGYSLLFSHSKIIQNQDHHGQSTHFSSTSWTSVGPAPLWSTSDRKVPQMEFRQWQIWNCCHHPSTNVCKNNVKVKAVFCSNEFLQDFCHSWKEKEKQHLLKIWRFNTMPHPLEAVIMPGHSAEPYKWLVEWWVKITETWNITIAVWSWHSFLGGNFLGASFERHKKYIYIQSFIYMALYGHIAWYIFNVSVHCQLKTMQLPSTCC